MSLVAAQPIVSSGGLESWSVELVALRTAQAPADIAREDGRVLRFALGLLRDRCAGHRRVQLRVSDRSLMHAGFAEEWVARIRVAGLEPGRLVLAVDAAAAASRRGTRRPLEGLARAGATLALDDVSTSPEILRAMDELPIGQVRVRAADVRDAAQGDPGAAGELLRASLAARLHGARCLAQGVGTETELGVARDTGCDLVQGPLAGGSVLVMS